MKALVLANTGKEHFIKGKCVPTCFLPVHGGLTIIKRTFSLLSVSGFSLDDICVCFGTGGMWEGEDVQKNIEELRIKKVYTNDTDVLNRRMLDEPFFDGEDLLVVDGAEIIDLAIFTRLLRYKEKDVLVIKDLLCPDDCEKLLTIRDSTVIGISNSKTARFPWVGYAGVCKLSKEFLKILNDKLIVPLPLLDAIGMVLNEGGTLKVVNYDDLGYGIIRRGHSSELIGGSYSKLNYRLVVRKEADGDGRQKLINEINWLMTIPKDLKPYFSSVLEYDTTGDLVYYNVPYYGSRNLREYIFAGNFTADDTVDFLKNLLYWMFKNIYSRKIGKASEGWTVNKHINRVFGRLEECCQKSEALKHLITVREIIINGIKYQNIRELYKRILREDDFIKRVNPTDLVMIHGDLHFQNILLSDETDTGFILVDPRGEYTGSDIYYDIGKLLHSIHGKYDFIHSDQFRLKFQCKGDGDNPPIADFIWTNEYMSKVYDEIYGKFLNMIAGFDYMKKDCDWEMKALWAEACHFCSVMPFHIGKSKTPDRVIVLYLTGVILINEFYDRYLKGEV
jgi:hypothetical protein